MLIYMNSENVVDKAFNHHIIESNTILLTIFQPELFSENIHIVRIVSYIHEHGVYVQFIYLIILI